MVSSRARWSHHIPHASLSSQVMFCYAVEQRSHPHHHSCQCQTLHQGVHTPQPHKWLPGVLLAPTLAAPPTPCLIICIRVSIRLSLTNGSPECFSHRLSQHLQLHV